MKYLLKDTCMFFKISKPCISGPLFLVFVILFIACQSVKAQEAEFPISEDSLYLNTDIHQMRLSCLIVPASFVSYGALSFAIPKLKGLDVNVRNEVIHERPYRTSFDDYTQYIPAGLVYALNITGIKGKHNYRDLTMTYAVSQILSAMVVVPAKRLIAEERPDRSDNKSFPSGHASTAFSTAHFMYKEYKEYNFWLAASGYPFAVFTGIYRVINNKHWASDVVAGAGIGIAATEFAYWLTPRLSKLLKGKDKKPSYVVLPVYTGEVLQLSFAKRF